MPSQLGDGRGEGADQKYFLEGVPSPTCASDGRGREQPGRPAGNGMPHFGS